MILIKKNKIVTSVRTPNLEHDLSFWKIISKLFPFKKNKKKLHPIDKKKSHNYSN